VVGSGVGAAESTTVLNIKTFAIDSGDRHMQ
jgi:hypothetical protein